MKLMNVRTLVRGGYLSATEPVQVVRGTEILGVWSPATAELVDMLRPPAPRSGPQPMTPAVPTSTMPADPAGVGVGERSGSEAQSGVPDPGVLGSLPLDARPSSGGEGSGTRQFPAPQAVIPPKPAGYVHDPSFNRKGSRPAPKGGTR